MRTITFSAVDGGVERLEASDASKSEVSREVSSVNRHKIHVARDSRTA